MSLRRTYVEICDEVGDFDEAKSEEVMDLLENKIRLARKHIDGAYKIAEEHNIWFRPIGDLFTEDEIEKQGWDSSSC